MDRPNLYQQISELSPTLQRRFIDEVTRADLSSFVRRAFTTLNPGDLYRHNWHIDAMTHHLGLVRRGEARRLLITVPPRSLKSIITSVALPAFLLGHDPSLKIVCISYSDALANELSNLFRTLISCPWYQALFPRMRIDRRKDSVGEVRTTGRGSRYATSIGGALTGFGADWFIIDDPMKAQDAASESSRERVRQWASSTLASRENDPGQGRQVLVMQRLHAEDLVGHYLEAGGWHHLNLPAIAQEDQIVPIGLGCTHLFRRGDLLDPVRLSQPVLDERRRDLGTDAFQAQYLQQPVPPGGRLFKLEWFQFYDQRPSFQTGDELVISWDTANKDGQFTDYSVATVWLRRGGTSYLLDCQRARLEFPALLRRAVELWNAYPHATVLIEDAGSGTSLIQSLRSQHRHPIAIRPDGDKVVRASGQTAQLEARAVLFPKSAPWLSDFLAELLSFPGKHDDQVDSMVQALSWLQHRDGSCRTVIVGRQASSRR